MLLRPGEIIMNHLAKIKIEGYKSIKQVELEIKNINILIGENGAGKSNLMSIFDLIEAIREYELQTYVNLQGGMSSILYNGWKSTRNCYLEIFRDKYMFYSRISADNADTCFLSQQGVYDVAEGHNLYAADGFRELKDDGVVKRLRLLDDIGVYHFHDTSVTSLMKANCDINDNIELASDGRNIAAILYRIMQNDVETYQYIVRMVQLVAPYFKDFLLRVNPLKGEKIRLEWLKRECNMPFGAEHLSDGTLRFICIVTLLCLPEEMKKDVICIDEPELGLHPSAITIITELMKKYAHERQIIVATQSVEIVDSFEPGDIVVVDSCAGESKFRRLDEKELSDWLEDYTIGELWRKNLIGGRP